MIELFNNGEPKDFDALLQEGPQSKNLSLAKLLAEERLAELKLHQKNTLAILTEFSISKANVWNVDSTWRPHSRAEGGAAVTAILWLIMALGSRRICPIAWMTCSID